MGTPPSAFKTYGAAIIPPVLHLIPNTCDEWTALFELVGSGLAVWLVACRLKRELTHKKVYSRKERIKDEKINS